jgi:hypothetical protein
MARPEKRNFPQMALVKSTSPIIGFEREGGKSINESTVLFPVCLDFLKYVISSQTTDHAQF